MMFMYETRRRRFIDLIMRSLCVSKRVKIFHFSVFLLVMREKLPSFGFDRMAWYYVYETRGKKKYIRGYATRYYKIREVITF